MENVLEKHAPLKSKILRGNNKPHINKSLRKEIMLRSRLKNIANASANQRDWIKYKKQRNKVVALNRKIKAEFFQNAQVISNNHKNFWKACKPLLSSKINDGNDRIIF